MVECQLPKLKAAGSTPVSRSKRIIVRGISVVNSFSLSICTTPEIHDTNTFTIKDKLAGL